MILLIDNYDSFAHNLARYLRLLGQGVHIVRNNRTNVDEIRSLAPAAIVMSPGPCTPDQAGVCLEVVARLHRTVPILGVCLGHQAICQALGATIARHEPAHGQAGLVHHTGHPLFNQIPSPFPAGRYHSLVAVRDSLPAELTVIATLAVREDQPDGGQGPVMAVAHREFPVAGVQFHPESVLTPHGMQLLANFLQWANLAPAARPLPEALSSAGVPQWTVPRPMGTTTVTPQPFAVPETGSGGSP
jgi:anthranilate synthase component 2